MQLEEAKAKKEGNMRENLNTDFIDALEENLLTDSFYHNRIPLLPLGDDCTFFDLCANPCVSLSTPSKEIGYSPNASSEHVDSPRTMSSSFHYLSPIEESSEPSTMSSGSSIESNHFSLILQKASSLHNIAINNEWNESFSDSLQSQSQTFPKYSKPSSRNEAGNLVKNRTLFPLEPRELDPDSFPQLHSANSQEELQEFLLLESQCLSNEGDISAAFIKLPK